ncbi:hypothetical protein JTB14_002242 [Gonioctena quinquepunctata]|nr:hypothetical protein JTB14_002242 [Gonioctena quinquepunctata]
MHRHQQQDINGKLNNAENYLLNLNRCSEDELREFKHKLLYIESEIKRRWSAASYDDKEVFLNNEWLQGIIVIPPSKYMSGRERNQLVTPLSVVKDERLKSFVVKWVGKDQLLPPK